MRSIGSHPKKSKCGPFKPIKIYDLKLINFIPGPLIPYLERCINAFAVLIKSYLSSYSPVNAYGNT